MKIAVGRLRELFAEALEQEAKVGASPEYMAKERVRELLQGVIVDQVSIGEIESPQDLEGFFGAADMALKALKMVPISVWQQLAAKKPNKKR